MAKIIPIKKLTVAVVPGERDLESNLINIAVCEMYKLKDYDKAPKSSTEAKERGEKGFNGNMSSFTFINLGFDGMATADIMATRYLFGQAVRDIAKESGNEIASKVSVNMANVSLLAATMFEGEPVLIAQVKGNVLGEGQIHAAMTAGNVSAKYLTYDNPLLKTLQAETSEEVGLDLSDLNPTSFCFMVDESETGQVNFAAVASGVDFNKVMAAYQASIVGKPLDKLEVRGLAIIPIRYAASIRDSIEIFEPNGKGGGEWKNEKRGLRPYTEALIDWLAEVANQESLIQKAGI